MVREMCAEAGIGFKTNHSLRASGASAMFRANVPEKIIQKTTGHRSIEALRSYERISTIQQKAVSKVLVANTTYENAEVDAKQDKKPKEATRSVTDGLSRVFGDMTNCTLGNIAVNINPTFKVFQFCSRN